MKLQQDCVKHLQPAGDALANQILVGMLKACSRKAGPVKLSEVAEAVYGNADKDKQDVVRLTMEKTLIRCGIVDKIYFSERDVRYFPTSYRFQEVSRVETATGSKIEQLVGDLVELPRQYWPVPAEVFDLIASREGYEEALAKLEGDSKAGRVAPQSYDRTKKSLQKRLEDVTKKAKQYEAVTDLIMR